jgi:hypothetical protein
MGGWAGGWAVGWLGRASEWVNGTHVKDPPRQYTRNTMRDRRIEHIIQLLHGSSDMGLGLAWHCPPATSAGTGTMPCSCLSAHPPPACPRMSGNQHPFIVLVIQRCMPPSLRSAHPASPPPPPFLPAVSLHLFPQYMDGRAMASHTEMKV